MLSKRAQAITPSITLGISAKVKQMQKAGTPIIDLSIGEPDLPTPPCAKAGGQYAIDHNITKYDAAAGNPELKKAICQKLQTENGVSYEPAQIVVTNGAKHAITNAVLALIDEGDEVIIPVPYWVSYPEIVSLIGGKPVYVETRKEAGFKLRVEDLEGKLSAKTKMVILTNPSNPTGNVYSKDELEKLCRFFADKNIWILADEIYERVVFDAPFTSVAALGEDIKAHTIIVNGFSKSVSMTGWRLGYTATPKEVAKAMADIQSHLTAHPSTISMQAGLYALKDCAGAIEEMRQIYKKRRDRIVEIMKDLPEISYIPPMGAFYLFFDISALRQKLQAESLSIKVCEDMLDKQVAFVPGLGFGADDFIRMSYAASEEDIEEGLKRFKAYVREVLAK